MSDQEISVITSSIFPTSWNWQPPSQCRTITTIDTHTGGGPFRIPIAGLPPIHGNTVLEKRRYFMKHLDHIRSGLILEPRGHADMYGAILTTTSHPDADLDCFFLTSGEYSTMCGHGTLAITKVIFETGVIHREGIEKHLTLSTPAGLVHAKALVENGTVIKTSFRNVPSFAYLLDQTISVPDLGEITFDISFGGNFFAIIDTQPLKLELNAANRARIVECGHKIKKAILASPEINIKHPFEEDLSSKFEVILTGPAETEGNHSRNVLVIENGDVDRSSCGTGISSRAALHFAKGELAIGEEMRIESILGSVMSVKVLEKVSFGRFEAIVPEVSGVACITGRTEFYFYEEDKFKDGFKLS